MTCEDEQLVHLFTVPFDAKSGHPTAFGAVHRCAHCGRACVSPMPDIDQIPAHYDIPAYYTHNTSHLPEVTPSLMDRLVTHLAWRTDHAHPFDLQKDIPFAPQDRTGLDIGCGHGNLLSNMRDLGLETFGIDPDEQARAEAEKKGHRVFTGTAETLPGAIASGTFDVITMTHVLEHCLNPLEALKNARALLSPDGMFYCEVPNAGSLYFQTYGQISEMLDVPRHLFFFGKTDLQDLASRAGLEITGWRFHGLTRHFGAGWKAWENSIHARLIDAGITPSCAPRSFLGDLKLLAAGLGRAPELRYDSIGFTAHRAGA